MLSLYKLEIFASVVQYGSFSAAAAQLHMTQPAVSQHIHDLERHVGTSLFNRGRRGVTLTEAGTTLFDYTQRILRLVAEAEASVTNVENLVSGQLSVGSTPGVSVYLLPEWLQGFRGRYPNLGASLTTNTTTHIINDVLSHQLDIGFVEGELDDLQTDDLGFHVLAPIDLLLVVGEDHPWHKVDTISIEELDDHPFVTRQPGSRTRIWIDHILRQHHVKPRIVAEFDNPEAIKQSVMSNLGVTILPEYAVRREIKGKLLYGLNIQNVPLERNLKIIWDANLPYTPVARAFLQFLSTGYPSIEELL
ncbi:MAG: LysR family transcriptional regulator [Anaerolineaceae bacterium]|nr:LysR family transcriptional regulator [Anaerolineaceae bacterium]